MLKELTSDLAGAARSLRRMPLLAGGAAATLALAVGLNVAVFGLVDRALFAAPPRVTGPERLFTLGFAPVGDAHTPAEMRSTSYPAFNALRKDVPAFESAAAFQRMSATLMLEGDQRSVRAMLISEGYFDALGARAFLGQQMGSRNTDAVSNPSVFLSYAFWQSVFDGDAALLGRRLTINGIEYAVAGVMPEGFSGHSATSVDLWLPFAAVMRDTPGWDLQPYRNIAGIVARLAPGASRLEAERQAGAVMERRVSLTPVQGSEVGPTERKVSLWLCAIAVLVLVAGLANSAVLLVVRGVRSRRVLAIRAALGASSARLRGQAAMEAVLLAGVATILSLVLASWMTSTLGAVLFPGLLAQGSPEAMGLATAGLAGLAAAGVAAAAGLSQIPSDPLPLRRTTVPAGTGGRSRALTLLLLVQTALAVVLLAGAGLLGASLHRLRAQDFGMAMEGVLVVDFEQTSAEVEGQDRLFTEGLERVKALPGVRLASFIDSIPFAGFNVPPIAVPGREDPPSVGGQLPFLTATTPEFLTILGVRVLEGRTLVQADDRGAPVVLVNQTMARLVWPGERALGKCLRIGFDPGFDPTTFDASSGPPMPSAASVCREVVGVVADVRQRSVLPFDGEDRLMQYFVPFSQVPTPPFAPNPTRIRGLLVSVDERVPGLASAIRRAVVAGSDDLPYLRVRPYAELLDRQMRPWTMGTRLLAVFSALALTVAGIGMFAAFAHAVAERRREMAVRLAVGARPAQVLRLVLGEALAIGLGGVALGALGAAFLGRGLRSVLFETAPFDPLVFAGSAILMLLLAAAATYAPARDAAGADPAALLRSE